MLAPGFEAFRQGLRHLYTSGKSDANAAPDKAEREGNGCHHALEKDEEQFKKPHRRLPRQIRRMLPSMPRTASRLQSNLLVTATPTHPHNPPTTPL